MRLRTVDLVRLRPSGRARHGDEPKPDEAPLRDCVLAPPGTGPGQEDNDRASRVDADLVVYAPVDADVLATDRVRVPSGPYKGDWDVAGEPARYRSPYTSARRSGTVIALKRTGG